MKVLHTSHKGHLGTHHTRYFSVTVRNIMTKSNSWNEKFILAYVSRELRVHHGGEACQWAAGMVARAGVWELTSLTTCKRQREKNWRQDRTIISKPSPSALYSSSKASPPRPPQTLTPTHKQVFKYPSLWGNVLTQTTTAPKQKKGHLMLYSTSARNMSIMCLNSFTDTWMSAVSHKSTVLVWGL